MRSVSDSPTIHVLAFLVLVNNDKIGGMIREMFLPHALCNSSEYFGPLTLTSSQYGEHGTTPVHWICIIWWWGRIIVINVVLIMMGESMRLYSR